MPPSSLARPGPAADRRRLAPRLPGLRRQLERQRDFRVEQIAHLTAHEGNRSSPGSRAHGPDGSGALHEVRGQLLTGARRALADIDLALAAMDEGRYGRCRGCGSAIPLAVVVAVPTSTSCLRCQDAAPSRRGAPC